MDVAVHDEGAGAGDIEQEASQGFTHPPFLGAVLQEATDQNAERCEQQHARAESPPEPAPDR